ncbi:MAG: aminoglycoside phosphotransferase family protein [Acidimicrobiaceae bacterium]|nr:aminoglycoside phosphotransferase family protein [Acidimicrobiaceae bacterium]
MTDIPASLSALTPEWVNERLAAGGHDSEVTSIEVRPLEGFSGIMGEVANLDLAYAADTDLPRTMIGKCPLDDELARLYNKVTNAYRREHGFYRDLHNRVPMTVARPFVNEYDDESGRAVLLIEKIEGTAGDILDGPDIEMFNELIRQLGTMHGQYWGSDVFGSRDWAIDWSAPSLRAGIPILRGDWPLMRQIWPDMGPVEILDFFERTWVDDTETWLDRIGERPWTMVHGDYEFDNIFFAADGPVILDWQTTIKSNPGQDVAWFLGVGATEESVAEEDALLDAYRAALAAAGGPDWSKEELLDDAAASLQFHCTGSAAALRGVIAGGGKPEHRSYQRFEKMVDGMMACAVRWNVLDRVAQD